MLLTSPSDRRPRLAVVPAYGRAFWWRRRLLPGDLLAITELERGLRTLRVDLAERYGPVFKALMERRLSVCVVGQALGRRLLRACVGSMLAVRGPYHWEPSPRFEISLERQRGAVR